MLEWIDKKLTPKLVSWTTIVGNATLIIAIVIAYLTFKETTENSRVEKSLSYVNSFNSGELMHARNVVYRVWKDYDINERAPGGSRDVINAIVERVTEGHDRNGPERAIKTSIVNITTFFDGVAVCARSNVCDRKILQAQLGPYARSFHCLYAAWIDAERTNYNLPALGIGLVELAEDEGRC